jgi:hypothetical protein
MSNHRIVELQINPLEWQREQLTVVLGSAQSSCLTPPALLKSPLMKCNPGIFIIAIPRYLPVPELG